MKFLKSITLATLMIGAIFISSCSNDDNGPYAKVTINEGPSGDLDGDVLGDGGSTTKTYNWQNALTTADYNADITTSTEGVFAFVVKDAQGAVVLDKSLNGLTEPDSFSGVTASGTAGTWSVTITLTTFNGDGSFSLSEGN